MRLFDTSYYHQGADVDNYLIEVLPVNKKEWITFNVRKGFSLVLNSSNLKYKKVNKLSDLMELPDGIYEIRQSVKPNIHTYVLYYHLRTVELESKIKKELNKLFNDKCRLDRSEFLQNRDTLRDIEEYAQAAKYMVEECNDKQKGKEMYEYAKEMLERYGNLCKC